MFGRDCHETRKVRRGGRNLAINVYEHRLKRFAATDVDHLGAILAKTETVNRTARQVNNRSGSGDDSLFLIANA